MLTTPQGKLSRYFYGIDYAARDLRLGLMESSTSKIGSPVEQLLLYCYKYDPATGKYGAAVMRIMRIAGVATLLGILALLLFLKPRNMGSDEPENWRRRLVMQSYIPLVPERASSFAWKVDALYFYLSGVTLFFTLLISATLIFFVIRYRRRSPYEIPRPVAGSHKLETIWTIIPFVIAMTMFLWGATVYFEQYKSPDECDGSLRGRASNGCGSCNTPPGNARSTSCTCLSVARSG